MRNAWDVSFSACPVVHEQEASHAKTIYAANGTPWLLPVIQESMLLYDLDVVSVIGDGQAGTRTSSLNGIQCQPLCCTILADNYLSCKDEHGDCGERTFVCCQPFVYNYKGCLENDCVL